MGIKQHTPGKIRYWEYNLEFPDGDHWVKYIPFVNDLAFELKRTSFGKVAEYRRDLMQKGEIRFSIKHAKGTVKHCIRVKDEAGVENWGSTKAKVESAVKLLKTKDMGAN